MSDHPNAGQSVWQELEVVSADRVAAFYRDVLGWELAMKGATGLFTFEGAPVAGIRLVDSRATGETAWKVYLHTDDLQAAAAALVARGGAVVRKDIELTAAGRAESLLVTDPFGAWVGLTTLSATAGAPAKTSEGHLALGDAMTTDTERGLAFYDALFGGNRTQHGPTFWCYRTDGGRVRFGVNSLTEAQQAFLSPHWLPWFVVADHDAAVAAATARGTVNVSGVAYAFGTFAVVRDPAGGEFKLLQPSNDKL